MNTVGEKMKKRTVIEIKIYLAIMKTPLAFQKHRMKILKVLTVMTT